MCFATNAQIGYLRMLLQEAGYPHRMGSAYAELSVTLREQGGTVEDRTGIPPDQAAEM